MVAAEKPSGGGRVRAGATAVIRAPPVEKLMALEMLCVTTVVVLLGLTR